MTTRRCAAAALAIAAALAGCGVQPEDEPRPILAPRGPFQALGPRTPAPTATVGSTAEQLFLVKDGALVPVTRYVEHEPTVQSLISDLLAGPTEAERDAGITSALLGSRVVSAVRVTDGGAVVELASPIEGTGRNDEMLAYAQLVCTLTARPGISGVTFTQDQQPIGVPRADGSLSQGPLTTADYAHLIAER